METSTYEQHAIEFLASTKTSFKAEFKEFNSMPWDEDGKKRNIFKITLKNEKGKYSFDFGSSLNDSLKNANDTFIEKEIDLYCGLKYEGLDPQYLSYSAKIKIEDLKNAKTWKDCEKLIDKKRAEQIYKDFRKANTDKYRPVLNIITFNEWFERIVSRLIQKTTELYNKNWGVGIPKDEPTEPTAYDVLTCLTKYDPGTFENFCSDFGYDSDSRKAYKTYKAVKREWSNVEILWTDEELEQLQEIQ